MSMQRDFAKLLVEWGVPADYIFTKTGMYREDGIVFDEDLVLVLENEGFLTPDPEDDTKQIFNEDVLGVAISIIEVALRKGAPRSAALEEAKLDLRRERAAGATQSGFTGGTTTGGTGTPGVDPLARSRLVTLTERVAEDEAELAAHENNTDEHDGLNQGEVDTRVQALVENWAETGNVDLIPAAKLANAPGQASSGPGSLKEIASGNNIAFNLTYDPRPGRGNPTLALSPITLEVEENEIVPLFLRTVVTYTVSGDAGIQVELNIDNALAETLAPIRTRYGAHSGSAETGHSGLSGQPEVGTGTLWAHASSSNLSVPLAVNIVTDTTSIAIVSGTVSYKVFREVAGGVGGGLTEAQVDARVRVGTQDWAETGNNDRLPKTKMPTDTVYTADGVTKAQLDAEAALRLAGDDLQIEEVGTRQRYIDVVALQATSNNPLRMVISADIQVPSASGSGPDQALADGEILEFAPRSRTPEPYRTVNLHWRDDQTHVSDTVETETQWNAKTVAHANVHNHLWLRVTKRLFSTISGARRAREVGELYHIPPRSTVAEFIVDTTSKEEAEAIVNAAITNSVQLWARPVGQQGAEQVYPPASVFGTNSGPGGVLTSDGNKISWVAPTNAQRAQRLGLTLAPNVVQRVNTAIADTYTVSAIDPSQFPTSGTFWQVEVEGQPIGNSRTAWTHTVDRNFTIGSALATTLENNLDDDEHELSVDFKLYDAATDGNELASVPLHITLTPVVPKVAITAIQKVANEAAYNAITTKSATTLYWWE